METIHIYHTNDIHSHLENWPRIRQFLKKEKERHQQTGDQVFLFDIGDFIDRWHPYTEATLGKGNIEFLNECQYNAVAIGNNEGVNLAHDDLNHLYDHAKFDILTANLFQKNGNYPDWIKPYMVYQTAQGTKVGVIGLTAYFAHLYELLGWKLTEPFSELKKWIQPLRKMADVVILLSHLGIHDDERIAAEFPEIDVILGAHTHHHLDIGKRIGNSIIGAAGKYGHYVGHVTLTLNNQKQITAKNALLYVEKDLPSVENEDEIVHSFLDKGREMLQNHVITLKQPLESDPFRETELALILCRAIREWCNADCAMLNAGLLLGPLANEVTDYDLLSICPHPINPCVVDLTGKELLEIISETKDQNLVKKHIKGLGFRGSVLGIFVFDQISFVQDKVLIHGEEVNLEKNYTLALPDMFTFGHFFKNVLPHKEKNYFLPEFLRDILKWKFQM
ncbi:bifunctional metallophosphatase/5'-nucleotidase [Bacillus sp. BRMEA1]|uniref:bifunctional metallophosphatase/5'-nucleotidase n=1 Tax=Neobacillus endophyticus TaxID=2738405 RepID=UPI001564AA09|nr:bifunctional UDP-sugar hydrolase/5'-nucleotidase [Neobacillus endophyticus]NRD76411.1 bifunctional metallophosphatase/5'-nucleotidase [Neobacillus endophyticus]